MLRAACIVIVLAPWVLSPESRSTNTARRTPWKVDAMVREEALILCREEGLFDDLRDLLVGHRDAPLFADLRHESAISRIDPKRDLQLDFSHRLGGGQVRGEVHVGGRQGIGGQK